MFFFLSFGCLRGLSVIRYTCEDRQRDGKIQLQAHVRVQIAGKRMNGDYLGMEEGVINSADFGILVMATTLSWLG